MVVIGALSIIGLFSLIFGYSCCVVSSRISRMEENMEIEKVITKNL